MNSAILMTTHVRSRILHVHVHHSFGYLNVSFKVVAGYDNGLDPRQPRDLKVPEYSKLVSSNNKSLW